MNGSRERNGVKRPDQIAGKSGHCAPFPAAIIFGEFVSDLHFHGHIVSGEK